MNKKHWIALVLALAFGGASAATARASLTGLSLTLTDLDPGDGIAPAFVLPPGWLRSEWSATSVSTAMPDGSNGWSGGYITSGLLVPDSFLLERTPSSFLGARWHVEQSPTGASLVTAASARGSQSLLRLAGGAPFEGGPRISLTPNTRATLSFQLAMDTTAWDGCDPGTGVCDQAHASAAVRFLGVVEGTPDLYPEGLSLDNHAVAWSASATGNTGGGPPITDSRAGSFSWSVTNETPLPAFVYLGYELDARSIAAVPEPQTWALALLGLAAVGWQARRPRR